MMGNHSVDSIDQVTRGDIFSENIHTFSGMLMLIRFVLIFTTSFVSGQSGQSETENVQKLNIDVFGASLNDIQEVHIKIDVELYKSDAGVERKDGDPQDPLGSENSRKQTKFKRDDHKSLSVVLPKPKFPKLEPSSPCDLCIWVYNTALYYLNTVLAKTKPAVDKILEPVKPMVDMVAKLWNCLITKIKKILSLGAYNENQVADSKGNGAKNETGSQNGKGTGSANGAENENVGSGVCGTQASQYHPTPTHRIINGQEAKPHSWPWQVYINFLDKATVCGGSILRVNEKLEESDVILTAAHCVMKDRRIFYDANCRAGLHDEEASADVYVQERKSYIAVPHQEYRESDQGHEYDIDLLFVKEPFKFTDEVQPICLPNPEEEIPVEKQCVVTGWGLHTAKLDETPPKLQQLVTPVLKPDKCRSMSTKYVEKTLICAGDLKASPCQGDSGGPLQCKREDGKCVQYGIAESSDCEKFVSPAHYTRVSAYSDWINEKIKKHSKLKQT